MDRDLLDRRCDWRINRDENIWGNLMNQFPIDGTPYRAVYQDNPHGFGEERGGCCQLDGSDFTECQDCRLRDNCPADGEADE